jgi:hypothetical protein
MSTTRVLVAGLPQIVRDILEHAIVRHPDLELLAPGTDARIEPPPDVVILGGERPSDPHLSGAVLSTWPNARVVVVAPLEGDAVLYELKPHVTVLGRLSAAEIVDAVRVRSTGAALLSGQENVG